MILAALFLDVFASGQAKSLRVPLEMTEQELAKRLARGHEFRRFRILHCRPLAYPYADLRWAVSRLMGFLARAGEKSSSESRSAATERVSSRTCP
jgi:hypothetical protein